MRALVPLYRPNCLFGANAIDVSFHEPQLQPPPASGERSNPAAGTVLSQQSGRNRSQAEALPFSKSQTVTVLFRKTRVLAVAAYVPYHPVVNGAFEIEAEGFCLRPVQLFRPAHRQPCPLRPTDVQPAFNPLR